MADNRDSPVSSKRDYTDSWKALEQSIGTRPQLKGSPSEMRAQLDGLISLLLPLYPPPSSAVTTQDHSLGDFKIRVYTKTSRPSTPQPIGIYGHGGGYCTGNIDSEDGFCRLLVEHLDTTIVSYEYRLAPEFKAPAQLEDGIATFAWALTNATSFNGDPKKLYTIGNSAGAGLALSIARKVVLGQVDDIPADSIKGIVAFVPVAFHPETVPRQYEQHYTSYTENDLNTPIIDAESMSQFFEYTGLKPDDKDYLVGLDTDALGKFPPTYIVTCEFDPLRDDGKCLEIGLKSKGVGVKRDHYDGLPHDFWIFPGLPETQLFVGKAFEGVMWVIGQMVDA